MIKSETQKKWFENKNYLIIFLFLLPPVGIFGMLKGNSKLWKKLLYTLLALFNSLMLTILSFAIILNITNPINHFKDGNEYFKNSQFEKAITEFKEVDPNDENYNIALKKMNIATKKIEEQKVLEDEILMMEKQKLLEFQKNWADSIIKIFEGDYIKKAIFTPSLDKITFQLIKKASTGSWQSGAKMNQTIFQKDYDSLVNKKYGNEWVYTQINFIADPEQEKINNDIAERKHLINRQFAGLSGSNYYVEKYIKENMNDPDSYEHIETSYTDKGSYILVQTKFRGTNSYGVKIIQVATAKVDIDGNVLSLTY